MKQYGLIGEKLGHSLSVPIHEAIWEKISLAASYRLIEIPRGELAAIVPELLCTLDGFNITVPYKTDVMLLLDEQDAPLTEAEQKLVQTVAGFLGRQMEN